MTSATATKTGFSFSLDPGNFAAVSAWVARRIPAKPKDPHLAGVVLEIVDGTTLTLSVFDYDVSTRATLEVTGEGTGRVLISGRLLAELVQTFPAKRALSVSYDGDRVNMSCGTWKGQLPTMPVEDYPQLPALPTEIGTVDAGAFAELIDQVGVAVSKDGSKPDRTGIQVYFGPDKIEAVAFDGYRSATASIGWTPNSPNVDAFALVPAAILIDASKMLGQVGEEAAIGLDDVLGLSGETINITTRLIGEKHIDIRAGMRKQPVDNAATIDVESLMSALRRADLVRGQKEPVTLVFDTQVIAVQVDDSDDGAPSEEPLNAQYEGPAITIACNPTYLSEALAALHCDSAVINVTAPMRPIILRPSKTSNGYIHTISPIKRLALPKD